VGNLREENAQELSSWFEGAMQNAGQRCKTLHHVVMRAQNDDGHCSALNAMNTSSVKS
jgi:hypothetical protein